MSETAPTADELKAMPIEEILRRMKLLMAELDARTAKRDAGLRPDAEQESKQSFVI